MRTRHKSSKASLRQLSAWQLVLIDCALIGIGLVLFALFDHVIPESHQSVVTSAPASVFSETSFQPADALATDTTTAMTDVSPQNAAGSPTDASPQNAAGSPADVSPQNAADSPADASPQNAADSPADASPQNAAGSPADASPQNAAGSPADASGEDAVPAQPAPGDFSQKFADKFTDGEVIQTETTYQSANLNITLNHYTFSIKDEQQNVYVQDIYIRSIECLRRCFAKDTYGKAIVESVQSMSDRSNAIGAINGDYYGHNNGGIVIMDGVMYRDRFGADIQTAVIFRDGNMKCYDNASMFDAKQVMEDGAWQSFSFGPILLLDGQMNPKGYAATNHDPRTIIGMVEPGHYMFIAIDGRQGSYADGMTYKESAEFCQKLGCTVAFNLDGGKTTQMTFQGKTANRPYKNGRPLSDIAFVAEP